MKIDEITHNICEGFPKFTHTMCRSLIASYQIDTGHLQSQWNWRKVWLKAPIPFFCSI